MKKLALAFVVIVVLGIGLGAGLFANQTGGLLAWFCLSPFAFIFLGLSLRGARLPLRLVSRRESEILDDYRTRRAPR